jgi:hypothetical protein
LRPGQNKPPVPTISDPHHVPETFVTTVVDAALISGSSITVTLGMRRRTRETFTSEPQEVIYVVDRLVLTLAAADSLMESLSRMLAQARPQVMGPEITTPQ